MRKLIVALILGLGLHPAPASPILASVGFGNQLNQGISSNSTLTNSPPLSGGETQVWFTSTTFVNTACIGVNAALCNSPTVTTSTSLMDSGVASIFTWASGLTYTTSSDWVVMVESSPPRMFTISTTGVFTAPGFDPTPGALDFSFQEPAVTAGPNAQTFYTFTASPPVPEPGSLILLGSGLLGIAVIGQRQRL